MAERDHPRMKHLQLIANGIAWPFLGFARTYHQQNFVQARTSPRTRKGFRPASDAAVASNIVPMVTLPPPFRCHQTSMHSVHEQASLAFVRSPRRPTTLVDDKPVDDAQVLAVDEESYERHDDDLADFRLCDGVDATPKIVNWLVDSSPDPLRRDSCCVGGPSTFASDRSLLTKHVSPYATSSRPSPSPSSTSLTAPPPSSSISVSRLPPSSANCTSSSHRIGVTARPEETGLTVSAEIPSLQDCRDDGWQRHFADEFDSRSATTIPLDFQCHLCLKSYSTVGAARLHARTHTLPCRCPACGKAFSRPWLLRGHWRTHTGERPFQCPDPGCRRAFADRSNLRAHLQTHAAVKKYCCGRCPKTFSRVSLLVKHKRTCCA